MPIYSKSIQNKEILNILKNKYKKILLIGCGACMNESLAYLYDLPLSVKGERDEYYPVPVIKELNRIEKMFEIFQLNDKERKKAAALARNK